MKSKMERLVRSNVRNWLCGLTEEECYESIAAEYDLPEQSLKVKAIIEWCCEGEFWTSNF